VTEAESLSRSSSFVPRSDPLASGSVYLVSTSAETGVLVLTLSAPVTADYVIWCRVKAPDSSADSFYVSVDGGPEDVYDTAEGIWSPAWQWTPVNGRDGGRPLTLNPRLFHLTAGVHQITFRGREADSTLDQILITNDLEFDPRLEDPVQ